MPVCYSNHVTAYVLNKYPNGGRLDIIDSRDYRTTPKGLTRSSYHDQIRVTMVSIYLQDVIRRHVNRPRLINLLITLLRDTFFSYPDLTNYSKQYTRKTSYQSGDM